MNARQTQSRDCCDTTKLNSRGTGVKVISFASAASAAGLAGIGCLGCIPFIGAAIASSALASTLDEHLVALQGTLIGLSATFSLFYFRRRNWPKLQIAIAAFAYVDLFLNSLYFENRVLAGIGMFALAISHVMRSRRQMETNSPLILLYFNGCPNLPVLKSLMAEKRITTFTEIDLETLPPGDVLKSYSSPSLLRNGELILGSKTSNASLSCSYTSREEIRSALERFLQSDR